MPGPTTEPIDAYFLDQVRNLRPGDASSEEPGDERWPRLFDAQATSRHVDFAARVLQKQGRGFYTIGSAGHESNAALGMATRATDPALLHYRSGAFYAARALHSGEVDPVREMLRSLTCSVHDPASGGRHKVIGHPGLGIIPQTSTIASHLPRSVGLAYALGLARATGRATPFPEDSVVVASFGDASLNHSTAVGSLNAASYLTHRRKPCPVLFVCEDNDIGISTRTPRGWTGTALRAWPGLRYLEAWGDDPRGLLAQVDAAVHQVRTERTPVILHLHTVRFMGHAGSDLESAYRTPRAIAGDHPRDPLLATARALVGSGAWTQRQVIERYEQIRSRVAEVAEEVGAEPRLASREAVTAPLALPSASARSRDLRLGGPGERGLTLAQSINRVLGDELGRHGDVLVFGEDVAVKGGVYGVTRGLHAAHGPTRVFDTLLDEQTVLGTALGTALAGFTPIPEIQYLAYLHNAEDQLRGEAASLRFFSDGTYRNGMLVRVAGLAYQRGFGGHFHNDNSVAVLRDIPGLVLAVPSHPALAPAVLRGCLEMAREDGRVCVVVEPIARYHAHDLLDGDAAWTAPYDETSTMQPGEVASYGEVDGRPHLLLLTFGNGVHLSLRVAATLRAEGVDVVVVDLVWLAPLPVDAIVDAAHDAAAVLVVDETRDAGGVGEAVVTALVTRGVSVPLARVASADSFVPLGPAAAKVLLQEEEILHAARALVARVTG